MTEAQWMKRITDLCDWLGLTWHHETDSRRSKAGFPDLVIVGRFVIFAELKADAGRIRPEQCTWLNALVKAGARAFVWRPADWPAVSQLLKECAA